MGISQYRLAKARGITAEMAWLLGQALGTTPQFWLNLQSTYDLKTLNTSKLPHVEALVG